MYITFFLLVTVSISYIDGWRYFRKDYVYYKNLKGWIKLHRFPARWDEARLRCHLEGSVLASPLNNELNITMFNISHTNSIILFTGFAGAYSKGDFISVEGVPLETEKVSWLPGNPDNGKDEEQCIAMDSKGGSLFDLSCDEPKPYICYKKNNRDYVSAQSCGTIDPKYVLDKRTKHCYKVHRYGQTWARANMVCIAEGGYMAIINSYEEAEIMSELAAQNPEESLTTKFPEYFSIGYSDWSDHGKWMTVQGQSLEEAGYDSWGPKQPDNHYGGEYCGGMYRNGELNDISCKVPFAFICEKLPDSLMDDDALGNSNDVELDMQ